MVVVWALGRGRGSRGGRLWGFEVGEVEAGDGTLEMVDLLTGGRAQSSNEASHKLEQERSRHAAAYKVY